MSKENGGIIRQFDEEIFLNQSLRVALLLILVSLTATSQGYYVGQRFQLPDTSVSTETIPLPISPNRDDVKAVGMGKTQLASGRTFNGMMYNPALLARDKFRFDIAGLQASLPTTTLGAASFLSSHADQFNNGQFLIDINEGIAEFNSATTPQQQVAAIQRINNGLRFLNELQAEVVGSQDNPHTHGLGVIPNIQAQFGKWGFSLFANFQSGFQVQPGQTISQIMALKLPDDPEAITLEGIRQLAGIVLPLINPNTGQLDLSNALPIAFAISYADIIGAVGYAHTLSDELSLGANLKVINRRLSTKRIANDNLDEIISETRKDFSSSVTGFTFDLGALYALKSTGTEFGLSLHNVIPIQKITSRMTANFDVGAIVDYQRDSGGNPITNANGDTALVAVHRLVKLNIPFDLETPFIANLGAIHALTDQWDVALDWVDIAAQDKRYENYIERIRVGSEFRLEAINEVLGIAFRMGLADNQVTGGLGLNLFRVVQIDGAIARDSFIDETAYYAQIKVGW